MKASSGSLDGARLIRKKLRQSSSKRDFVAENKKKKVKVTITANILVQFTTSQTLLQPANQQKTNLFFLICL